MPRPVGHRDGPGIEVRRLVAGDESVAKHVFVMMAHEFGEPTEELSDAQVKALLSDGRFWVMAAVVGDEVVGGTTAHTIPMTHRAGSGLFVYDLAVRADHRRRGVGRALMRELQAQAATLSINELFVLADNDDEHALDFYRGLGGVASAVTMFDFGPSEPTRA
jgi:aminoglycoside 3-N-acetyltransferase I